MTRTTLAALAAAALAVPAAAVEPPPLPPDRIVVDGGCDWSGVGPEDGPATFAVTAYAVAYATRPDRNLVTFERASCVVRRFGVTEATYPLAVAGPLATAAPVLHTRAGGFDPGIEICFDYAVVDAHGARTALLDCPDLSYEIPWWQTYAASDLVGWAYDEVNDEVFVRTVDPVVCPALRDAPPPPPGTGVTVGPDGDVAVAGELLWDCPPYVTG